MTAQTDMTDAGTGSPGVLGGVQLELPMHPAQRKAFRGRVLPNRPTVVLESAADPRDFIEIECIPAMPGTMAVDLLSEGLDKDTLPLYFARVFGGEEHYKRFREFVDVPAHGITLDVMLELAKYLMEAYTGRPTE